MEINIDKKYVYTIRIGQHHFSYDSQKKQVVIIDNVLDFETVHILSKILDELEQESNAKQQIPTVH